MCSSRVRADGNSREALESNPPPPPRLQANPSQPQQQPHPGWQHQQPREGYTQATLAVASQQQQQQLNSTSTSSNSNNDSSNSSQGLRESCVGLGAGDKANDAGYATGWGERYRAILGKEIPEPMPPWGDERGSKRQRLFTSTAAPAATATSPVGKAPVGRRGATAVDAVPTAAAAASGGVGNPSRATAVHVAEQQPTPSRR